MMSISTKTSRNTQYVKVTHDNGVLSFSYEKSFAALIVAINIVTAVVAAIIYLRVF